MGDMSYIAQPIVHFGSKMHEPVSKMSTIPLTKCTEQTKMSVIAKM